MNLVLASTSPYRKAQLEQLGLSFVCQKPDCDEEAFKTLIKDPFKLSQTLAFEKAKSCIQPGNLIIGADQVAACEGRILSKPKNFDSAVLQLSLMAGRFHSLFTAVSVQTAEKQKTWVIETRLKMKELTPAQIETYLQLDSPYDCAGSYKIEKHGLQLMREIITDDFSSIVGLPLLSLSTVLEEDFQFLIPAIKSN
jgi:septum formation protein